jgi:hypothetical protein
MTLICKTVNQTEPLNYPPAASRRVVQSGVRAFLATPTNHFGVLMDESLTTSKIEARILTRTRMDVAHLPSPTGTAVWKSITERLNM